MATIPEEKPDDHFALVISIEDYGSAPLCGPTLDAFTFLNRLLLRHVPPANLYMLASPLPQRRHLLELLERRGVHWTNKTPSSIQPVTFEQLRLALRQLHYATQGHEPACLWVMGTGHGLVENRRASQMVLQDYAPTDCQLLDINNLWAHLASANQQFSSYPRQQFLIFDMCSADYFPKQYGYEPARNALQTWSPAPECNQMTLFAAQMGQTTGFAPTGLSSFWKLVRKRLPRGQQLLIPGDDWWKAIESTIKDGQGSKRLGAVPYRVTSTSGKGDEFFVDTRKRRANGYLAAGIGAAAVVVVVVLLALSIWGFSRFRSFQVDALVDQIDKADDGAKLSIAARNAKASWFSGRVVNALDQNALTNTRRMIALLLIDGPGNHKFEELCHLGADRSVQTEVLAKVADMSKEQVPELEAWFLESLDHDQSGGDVGYCLGICLGMAWSRPDRRALPAGGFVNSLVEQYQTYPDPGVHSVLRYLLMVNGYFDIKKLDHALAAKQTKESVLTGPSGRLSWYVTPSGVTMIVVPPGKFVVSVPKDWKPDSSSPIPVNSVGSVDHWFAIASTEVSNDQFASYVKQLKEVEHGELLEIRNTHNGKRESWIDTGFVPATRVPWYYATGYCTWLIDRETGKDRIEKRFDDEHLGLSVEESAAYRLPLEEEWELACRAGSSSSRFFGESRDYLGRFAWFGPDAGESGSSDGVPRQTGTKLPNRWGLFDVYGNASEWCLNPFKEDFTVDLSGTWTPMRKMSGPQIKERSLRGGSCEGDGFSLFSSFRQKSSEGRQEGPRYGGFRIARTLPGLISNK
jgi:formylglycine-generating enzyme required for sulfatase activity